MCASATYFCDGAMGIVTSPNFPFQSGRSVTCNWHVQTPNNTFIRLSFTYFNSTGTCDKASLKISEKLSDNTNIVIGMYCDEVSVSPTPIESSLNSISMELASVPPEEIIFMVEYEAMTFETSGKRVLEAGINQIKSNIYITNKSIR